MKISRYREMTAVLQSNPRRYELKSKRAEAEKLHITSRQQVKQVLKSHPVYTARQEMFSPVWSVGGRRSSVLGLLLPFCMHM